MLWGYFIEERNVLSIPKCDCALHVMANYCFSIVVDKMARPKTNHTSPHDQHFQLHVWNLFFCMQMVRKKVGKFG
jgi:hypothetical protein